MTPPRALAACCRSPTKYLQGINPDARLVMYGQELNGESYAICKADLVIKALGFDPIWFNVVLLINMELALITPPVGMNLFVIKGISEDSSIQDIIAGSAPFAFIMVLEIALLCFFPGIATWPPSVPK